MASEIRKDRRETPSESTKARRRAAFISTIRNASRVDMAAARPASGGATGPRQAARSGARPVVTKAQPVAPAATPRPAEPRPNTQLARRAETLPVAPRAQAKTRAVEPARPRAAAPAASPAQPNPELFRAEALRHRLSAEEGRGLVRVSPPWTWALLWIVVTALGAALAASFVGKVEVIGRGRGIIRPAGGVRVLTAQAGGTVVRVEARSGDHVRAGAALLRIESASTQAQLLEAERDLEAVRTRFTATAAQEDQHYEEQVALLKARAGRLAEQIASLRGSEGHFRKRVAADVTLLDKGLVSEMAVGDTRDSLAQAQRNLSSAEQALDQTRQELASLETRRQEELWQRQQTVSAAQNKRDALALLMKQDVIRAPEDGTVDGLQAQVGETIQAGQVIGKIVPVGAPLEVVAFLPEKDRAFAKAGDTVELELDQLPHAEYGTLRARVVRIGDDLASPSEVREAFGESVPLPVPSYRVELAITNTRAADAAGVKLRTGALLNARFTLRHRRFITLLLSPLRKWFR